MGEVTNGLTEHQILYEMAYARARQYRDLAMAKSGVRLAPRSGPLSAAHKLREALDG